MLTRCPDCQREVSSVAPSCPQCGRPIAATTVEATGKRWKGLMLIGWLAIIIGIAAGTGSDANRTAGLALFGSGMLTVLVSAIGAWWNHG